MKKQYFGNVLAIMMVAMLSVGLFACGDSDDDNSSSTISWLFNSRWTESSGQYGRRWTFYENGSCKFEVDNKTWTPQKGYESHWETYEGRWNYSNDTKVLSTTVGSWNWVIVSHSDNMWTGEINGKLYTYTK